MEKKLTDAEEKLSESSKGQKNVTFHSPANQTATQNITRRKRSLSGDENVYAPPLSKIPRSVKYSQSRMDEIIQNLQEYFAREVTNSERNAQNYMSLYKKIQKNQTATQNITRRKRSLSGDENVYAPPLSKIPRPVKYSQSRMDEIIQNLQEYFAREDNKMLTNSERKAQNLPSTSNAANEKQGKARKQEKQSSSVLKKTKSVEDKLQKRTKNHIDMFKSCPLKPKNTTNRNKEIIHGVRSKRRYELMLLYRDMNDDDDMNDQ